MLRRCWNSELSYNRMWKEWSLRWRGSCSARCYVQADQFWSHSMILGFKLKDIISRRRQVSHLRPGDVQSLRSRAHVPDAYLVPSGLQSNLCTSKRRCVGYSTPMFLFIYPTMEASFFKVTCKQIVQWHIQPLSLVPLHSSRNGVITPETQASPKGNLLPCGSSFIAGSKGSQSHGPIVSTDIRAYIDDNQHEFATCWLCTERDHFQGRFWMDLFEFVGFRSGLYFWTMSFW